MTKQAWVLFLEQKCIILYIKRSMKRLGAFCTHGRLGWTKTVFASEGIISVRTRGHATVARKKEMPETTGTGRNGLRAIDLAQRLREDKAGSTEKTVPQSPGQKSIHDLKRLSQQLQSVHPNVLAKALHKGLLFQNKDIVAVNKPYGLPVHGGPGVKNNINDVLPILAKMVDGMKAGTQLHLCHRLDKETTGVMLLARSEEVARQVQQLFRTHQVEKKYMVLCVGIPVPSEGVIDIPIIEKEVSGPQPHFKMTLSPIYKRSENGDGMIRIRANRLAHSAATRYKVLESCGGVSLVELQPITGVKHQIRVHLAYGLGCPILGDHKYAQWIKLAPQKLPEGVLQKLNLEQSKARHLPLHLHARQLVLPEANSQQIIIPCPLPKFFISTMRKLKIPLPEKPTSHH